ncbi:MAG: tripartite tricarboxylate transporter substrate binding protein [Pseudomonadota bacterium]
MHRRHLLAAGTAGATLLAASPLSWAQNAPRPLPSGPVHIAVGFPPGGGTDVLARIIGQKLTTLWGVPIIVDNRAGVAGTIAADYVARQAGDGNNLLMAHISSNGIAPGLFPKLGYSAEKDFTPIAMVGQTPMVLVCSPAQPAKTLDAVVQLCRQNPGRVSFGSAGTGSAQHLALEEFKMRAHIDALHVPYKGSAPLMNDLIGGQIQYCFEGMTTTAPYVQAGRLAAIAQTRLKRSVAMPAVPTVAEQGYAGFDASIWFALVGPRRLPEAMARQMNADVNTVLLMPDVADKLKQYGAEDGGGTAEKLGSFMLAEQKKWARVIRDAKVTPES